MAIPHDKESLIFQIKDHYQKLKLDLELIPNDKARLLGIKGNIKGTLVSVSDIVAYLIGWARLVRKWENQQANSLPIDFPEKDFKWNELGLLAQKFHQDFKDVGYQNLLILLDQEVNLILQLIDSYNNQNLYHIPFYKHYPLGRMIQLNTSSPYKSNRSKIRKWMREKKI